MNVALREEIARLKGLKGPPKLTPSGMEKASEPARAGHKKGRRGGKIARLVIDEERVLEAAVPAGSRFKGYETYVVQELVVRPHVIRVQAVDGRLQAHHPPRFESAGAAASDETLSTLRID